MVKHTLKILPCEQRKQAKLALKGASKSKFSIENRILESSSEIQKNNFKTVSKLCSKLRTPIKNS